MNNISIDYDGRVKAWSTKKVSTLNFKAPILEQSPEWGLFLDLPSVAKESYLQSTMGLSNVVNSDKVSADTKKARRGTKGITGYGRSQVRCAAQMLEDVYGVKNLSFLTCTLPPEALADYTPESWAEVVHRFVKWLTYHMKKAGLDPQIVAVTEIQMHRWGVEKDLPPVHLHLVFPGRSACGQWAFRPAQLQSGWEQCVQSVWASRWHSRSSCRVECIRSSSVNYLGKYMSKGVSALKSLSPESLPSAWYSISTKLKELVKKAKFKVSGEAATKLYRYLRGSALMLWERDLVSYNPESGFLWHMAWNAAFASREAYHEIVGDMRDFLVSRETDPLTAVLR